MNSILQFIAYKKPHPLEESIKLITTINPSLKITKENDLKSFKHNKFYHRRTRQY